MLFCQSVHLSVSQSLNQSVSLYSQSASHSVIQSVYLSASQSVYPSVSRSISHSVHQSVSQSLRQSDSQTVRQSIWPTSVDLKGLRPVSKFASHQQEPQVEGGRKRRNRRGCWRGGKLKWTCQQRRNTQGNGHASKINRRSGVNCSAGYWIRINARCKLNARGGEREYHLLPWI